MDHFGSTISLIKLIDGANYDAVKEKIHSAYKELWDFWDGGFIKGIELVRLDKAYFSQLGGSLKQGNKRSVNILFIVAAVRYQHRFYCGGNDPNHADEIYDEYA